jgi:hypothetical protein
MEILLLYVNGGGGLGEGWQRGEESALAWSGARMPALRVCHWGSQHDHHERRQRKRDDQFAQLFHTDM